jgi:hypothetical protein
MSRQVNAVNILVKPIFKVGLRKAKVESQQTCGFESFVLNLSRPSCQSIVLIRNKVS